MAGPAGMKVTAMNGVKVYTVSGHRQFASWLPPNKKRALRTDHDYLRRIDLVQDLEFNTAATRMKTTPDGRYIIASGIYPPQVRVFELSELSLKFERHLTSEIVDFQVLGDDYSKLAFLCADRSVWLHAKFGSYFSTRIPRMGRDLCYDRWSCDLLLSASSPEVYRLNLEQGHFLAPLTTQSPGINVLGRSPGHGLIACGGEDGFLECFDLRQKTSVGRILAVGAGNEDQEVTSLRFDESEGMQIAVGTSGGQVLLYDLRSSTPIMTKDHMYGSPIMDIKWHESVSTAAKNLITSDSRIVRIWNPQTGDGVTNIEAPTGEINDVCVVKNSGLIFMALDSPRISSFFIPSLGPAPRWCSSLEGLTEELEEGNETTIYEDYKFVTREDLERLSLTNLLGTNLLRAYMHGYFIDHRLYAKAKAIANPFAYEEYRQKTIREKLDAERAARISVKKKLPKVNRELAARLLAGGGADTVVSDEENIEVPSEAVKKDVQRKKLNTSLLKDDRFAAIFKNEAFEVDEDAPEYRALHPNKQKSKKSLVTEHFDLVTDGHKETGAEDEDDFDGSSSFSDEGERMSTRKKRQQISEKAGVAGKKPRLYEVKDEAHAQAFKKKVSLKAERSRPLEERVAAGVKVKGRGDSFFMDEGAGQREAASRDGSRDLKKRGVQSLGLKSDRPGFGGRGGRVGRGFRGRGRGRS